MIGKTLILMAAATALGIATRAHYPMHLAHAVNRSGDWGAIYMARKKNRRAKAQKRRR